MCSFPHCTLVLMLWNSLRKARIHPMSVLPHWYVFCLASCFVTSVAALLHSYCMFFLFLPSPTRILTTISNLGLGILTLLNLAIIILDYHCLEIPYPSSSTTYSAPIATVMCHAGPSTLKSASLDHRILDDLSSPLDTKPYISAQPHLESPYLWTLVTCVSLVTSLLVIHFT
jgi:hypothetical protein